METRIGKRTLFMLHGDECTYVKGHYIMERMQINMLFAAALHILYLLTFLLLLLLLLGEGVTPLVQDCQDHQVFLVNYNGVLMLASCCWGVHLYTNNCI